MPSNSILAQKQQIVADLAEQIKKDFYGNPVQSNNIGCYGGTGVDTEYKGENIIEKIIRTILDIIETVKHEIYVIFD